MTRYRESTGTDSSLGSDFVHRVTRYQAAGTLARLELFALQAAQGVPAAWAGDLVEVGAVAGAQCEVMELDGMAPASWGPVFEGGWDEGVTAVSAALVCIADRGWAQRGGRSVGAAELAVGLADVRQREGAGLVRLEVFVREAVLSRAGSCTVERRWVLGELGGAGGLCTAWTVGPSTGEVFVCTREAGHYPRDDKPSRRDGEPGGWHLASASIWDDSAAYSHPHAAAEKHRDWTSKG